METLISLSFDVLLNKCQLIPSSSHQQQSANLQVPTSDERSKQPPKPQTYQQEKQKQNKVITISVRYRSENSNFTANGSLWRWGRRWLLVLKLLSRVRWWLVVVQQSSLIMGCCCELEFCLWWICPCGVSESEVGCELVGSWSSPRARRNKEEIGILMVCCYCEGEESCVCVVKTVKGEEDQLVGGLVGCGWWSGGRNSGELTRKSNE